MSSCMAKGQANSKRFVFPENHTLWIEMMLEVLQSNPPHPQPPHTHT